MDDLRIHWLDKMHRIEEEHADDPYDDWHEKGWNELKKWGLRQKEDQLRRLKQKGGMDEE